ncbi:MAG: nitroreductase family protein [Lachnospiraceae bacterium]|nr:nitroreductase family protein [Lachnospiraceae bacterium]
MDLKTISGKVKNRTHTIQHEYLKRYKKHTFNGVKCSDISQYEAVITRLYHTIEKGLSYENYRAGFGRNNIETLIKAIKNYLNDFNDVNRYFYRTAISVLKRYVEKNFQYGLKDDVLKKVIDRFPGNANDDGGEMTFVPKTKEELEKMNFRELMEDRHSIRHFSDKPVKTEKIVEAIKIAQHTPSACNRQGWKARIIANKSVIKNVLANQNGNSGFGQEIDKLIVVTSDLSYFNHDREVFQAFIDGGMYAESILNALHYSHIGSVPLSASLSCAQESNVRKILKMKDSEILILFIGAGNYPDVCITTKSVRHEPRVEVI